MRLDQKTALLTALPTFAILEPQAVHIIAFSAQSKRLQAGEELFRKGGASEGGYVVVAGRVALNPDGVTPMGAEVFDAGALIGEAALVTQTEHAATAIALEPSEVMVIGRAVMRQVLEAHPESAARLHGHVAAQLAERHAALRALAE